MFAENERISLRQLQAVLCLQCLGTAVLFLPAELAADSGQSCWLTAGIGSLLFAGASLLFVALAKEGGTVTEQCRKAFGVPLGTLVVVGLAFKFVFDAACELRLLSEVLCRFLLPATPLWGISLAVAVLCLFAATKGVEAYGRLGELLFFFVILPLLLLLAAVSVSTDYVRLLPLSVPSFSGIANGCLQLGIVFQGLPLLYLLFPYCKKKQSAKKNILWSGLLVGAVVTAIVLLSMAVYGSVPLSQKLLPTIQMLERIRFTGVFLTRQDVVFLWFWFCTAVVFLTGVLLALVCLAKQLFPSYTKKRKRRLWLWGSAAVIWAVSFLPENVTAAYRLRLTLAPWLQLLYVVAVPLALLLCFSYRSKGSVRGGKTDA